MRLLIFLITLTTLAPCSTMAATDQKPVVVVLHGLGLGQWAMKRVAKTLEAENYHVVNLSYESLKVPLEELVSTWLPGQLKAHHVGLTDNDVPLHFVTHSMGGIVLRGWLKSQSAIPPNLARVVMFAPPNQGSSLVDRIGTWKAFKLSTGVNGVRLSTAADSYPLQIGPWPEGPTLGIIAGDSPINPLLAYWTGGPGDGKVRVAESKLEGMTDHIVMPYSHTWIQYRRKPIDQVVTFLRDGRFKR
ncbi:hypothetical protein N9023_02900 [Opitutaceae bacterium]|nr:hypothetical protein [Opitutaceae bacterium]